MVDELNWTGGSTRNGRCWLSNANQRRSAGKDFTQLRAGAKLSSPALSKRVHICEHTHTHTHIRTHRVTFYGLSSCLGDACWQQQQQLQPLRFLALNSFRISHLEFGHYSMFYAATLPEDTERVFKGLLRVYSGIFRAAWHFYVLSRLHILWPQQSVRCCSV